jgi:hypothetical protein
LIAVAGSATCGDLSAQVPNYSGAWQLTTPWVPPIGTPIDRLEIAADASSISCLLGTGLSFWTISPLNGSFTAANQASLTGRIANQCGWSWNLTVTFTGPNQLQGSLQWVDLYCGWPWGPSHTAPIAGQRLVNSGYSSFGSGCGAPWITWIVPGVPPSITTGFQLTLDWLPNQVAIVVTGASRTAYGAGNLPLDLSMLGMPGCALRVSPDDTRLVTGIVVQVPYVIPAMPSLIGGTFYQQAFVPVTGANPLGAIMTNAMAGVIGP